MGKFIDLSGQIFNRLTVSAQSSSHNKHTMWECICECGKNITTSSDKLRSGNTQSCGCLRLERLREKLGKHFQSASANKGKPTKEYSAWTSMRDRCYNPKNKFFHHYGERGITICDKWLNSFPAFFFDMGSAPTKKHSIDRINNDLGYFPENCRWATQEIQVNNRRCNNQITFNGQTKTIADWSKHTGINRQTIADRIAAGWSTDLVLSVKPQRKNKTTS